MAPTKRSASLPFLNKIIVGILMTPELDDDPAWHHPLQYIEGLAEGKHAIFLGAVAMPSKDENLSNGQKFDLALLEHMTKQQFQIGRAHV